MNTTCLASLMTGFVVLAVGTPAIGVGPPLDADVRPTTAPQCADAEHRRLDFWVGDWAAYEAADRTRAVARAQVDVILGGCALRESYQQTDGLVGQSFTTYDARRKLWHQTWVTNRGQLLTIEGRFQGERLTLQGQQWNAHGQPTTVRAVWEPEAGGVREIAHTSSDGGKSWQPLFDVFFRHHENGAVMPDTSESDRAATTTLTQLNQEYVDAFMNADVAWYRDNLADDFVCIESDGSIIGRDEFLRGAARGPDVANYTLADVRIRVYGDVALVHATGRFTRRDGTKGVSRYTDVYVRTDGRWKAVSAQITRSKEAER